MVSRDELEVLEANDAFYAAFNGADLPALEALWAQDLPSACIHPGTHALVGRDEVLGSMGEIFASGTPEVGYEEAQALVLGETAFVVCVERVGEHALNATNIFALEDGRWKMVHHHAALGPVKVTTVDGLKQ